MHDRRLSVRVARMELDFALVEGKQDKIEMARMKLEEALAAAERRRVSAKRKSPHQNDNKESGESSR